MKRLEAFGPLAAAFRGDQWKPTVILLVSPLLLVTWKYFGAVEFYRDWLAPRLAWQGDPAAMAATYCFLAAFLLMGVVPLLIVKLVFRQRLADYGVQWGDRRQTAGSFLLLAPVMVAAAWAASRDPAVLAQYPINPAAGSSPGMFALHACTYLLYYLGWEFHFRGFLQFGLRDKIGQANALLVQVLASCLLHIGKPASETYSAMLGGILWGMIAFRTRSLLSGLLQHFLLGVALDWFICYG